MYIVYIYTHCMCSAKKVPGIANIQAEVNHADLFCPQ